MIFKPMSLAKAKEFYKELKDVCENVKNDSLLKIAMNDIWFFTEGLIKDYGGKKNNKSHEYIQIQIDV